MRKLKISTFFLSLLKAVLVLPILFCLPTASWPAQVTIVGYVWDIGVFCYDKYQEYQNSKQKNVEQVKKEPLEQESPQKEKQVTLFAGFNLLKTAVTSTCSKTLRRLLALQKGLSVPTPPQNYAFGYSYSSYATAGMIISFTFQVYYDIKFNSLKNKARLAKEINDLVGEMSHDDISRIFPEYNSDSQKYVNDVKKQLVTGSLRSLSSNVITYQPEDMTDLFPFVRRIYQGTSSFFGSLAQLPRDLDLTTISLYVTGYVLGTLQDYEFFGSEKQMKAEIRQTSRLFNKDDLSEEALIGILQKVSTNERFEKEKKAFASRNSIWQVLVRSGLGHEALEKSWAECFDQPEDVKSKNNTTSVMI